ncbi:MAG: hypothetical protein WCB94_10860 [Terriglobales bacterium]
MTLFIRRQFGGGYPVVRPPAYNLFTKQFGSLVCPPKGVEGKLSGVGAAIVLLLAIAIQTCPSVAQGSTPSQETPEKSGLVRTGPWGGQDVEMQVNEHGATVEFACANGNISESLLIDAKGKFRARGTFQRQHGGPNRKDESASGIDVTYTGTVQGDTMKLEFILPEKQQHQGPFTLVRGQEGHLRKCR